MNSSAAVSHNVSQTSARSLLLLVAGELQATSDPYSRQRVRGCVSASVCCLLADRLSIAVVRLSLLADRKSAVA